MTPTAADEASPPARRVGVFGGTFDPPHSGHVSAASDVADALDLDEVLWMPSRHPPHKDPSAISPADVRLEMTRAAAVSDPRFLVSDLEIVREGVSYTVDTLRALRDERPGVALLLMVGVDQYRRLDGWRSPAEILAMASLAVMDREGEGVAPSPDTDPDAPDVVRAPAGPGRPAMSVRRVRVRRVDISSTRVRERVAAGASIDGMVPPGVAEIVRREGLYRH